MSLRRFAVAVSLVIPIVLSACGDGDTDDGASASAGTSKGSEPSDCTSLLVMQGETGYRSHDVFASRDGDSPKQLTSDSSSFEPAVAPDGSWIIYTHGDADDFDPSIGYGATWLRRMHSDGTRIGDIERPAGASDSRPAVSPSGASIAFIRIQPGSYARLMLANADGTEQRVLVTIPSQLGHPAWAPDGKAIAVPVRGDESTYDIHVYDVADAQVVRHDAGGGDRVAWSAAGDKLLLSAHRYESGEPALAEVDVRRGEPTQIPHPRGASWTNGSYYGDDKTSAFLVLRFWQSLDPKPQVLEVIDRDATVLSRIQLPQPRANGGDGVVVFDGLSATGCFQLASDDQR